MSKYLDNKMMTLLSSILSSKARIEVLRTLCFLDKPIGLRKLARICEVHPRSAELALQGLIAERRVIKSPKGSAPAYRWNAAHADALRLQKLFHADMSEVLKMKTKDYQSKALGLCKFIDDGLKLVAKGRASLNDLK